MRLFEGNLSISGKTLHAFLLSAYEHNVAIFELGQCLDYVRLQCSYDLHCRVDDQLLGCYNVKACMGPDYFCELLAKSGVESSLFAMQCWLALQPPLPIGRLKDFDYFIGGWELDGYGDFLIGCCVAMPDITPQRLRIGLMQSMGVKCRLADIVRWALLHPGLCKRPRQGGPLCKLRAPLKNVMRKNCFTGLGRSWCPASRL